MERDVYLRMREVEKTHWWFTARREILTAEIERLGLPAYARILEAGCGTGGNLDMLRRFGAVEAVEPDAESRDYVKATKGIEVQEAWLPDRLPAFGHDFDLIAALDVIEHVPDDAGAVKALAGLLAPGGYLLTTVPAHPWMWSAHDEAHHHKRRYRLPEFRKLFEQAGLAVRRASFFNSVLFPPIAAVRLVKGRKGGGDDALPPAPLNAVLHAAFATERHLLRVTDLPVGVSILLIAQASQ